MSNKFDIRNAKDYLPLEQLRQLQLQCLRSEVERVYNNVDFYTKAMDKAGVSPQDILSLEDLEKLPFTTKADLHRAYPFGMCAVTLDKIERLNAAGSGKPLICAFTAADIATGAEVMTRAFAGYGINEQDIIQTSAEYESFSGELGATIISAAGHNIKNQIMAMKALGVSVACCTPTYFCFLIEKAAEYGIDLKSLPIRIGVFGSEFWSDETRKKIEASAGVKAFDIYGLPDIIGPGIAAECEYQAGLHVFEDHFYPEIIDPETGKVLPDGETGELVLTTLTKEAMPLIRLRTGDLTALLPETCKCGRTIRRCKRILSYSDDRIVVNGINVFPAQIEAALLSVEGTRPNYNIILSTENGQDRIEAAVEVTGDIFSDKVRAMERLRRDLTSALERTLGLRVDVILMTDLPEDNKKIIDNRIK
jgi:phenylacetate-CoA ligase